MHWPAPLRNALLLVMIPASCLVESGCGEPDQEEHAWEACRDAQDDSRVPCESYVNSFGEQGRYFKKASARLSRERALRFHRAVEFRNLEDLEAWQRDWGNYRGDEARKQAETVEQALEPALFGRVNAEPSIALCERYLNKYAKSNRERAEAVRSLMEPLAFAQAAESDFATDYVVYLKRFPSGKNATLARQSVAELRKRKAALTVEYPEEVATSGVCPSWTWDTYFTEKSGKTRCRLRGQGAIHDREGRLWATTGQKTIIRGPILVPAGGRASDRYTVLGCDHNLCGGHAVFSWTGEDAGGHPIVLSVRVHLNDPACPKSKRSVLP